MGDEADDILGSLDLTAAQKLAYDMVQEACQNHFIKRRNPIFERARFNQRKQEEGESVDSFITALYSLAKHCDYGALHDQMIRDRLVVGLRDAALSEKLQMDADLSLQTAISTACQRESVKKQQSVVRGDNQPNVDAVHAKTPYQGKSGKKGSSPIFKPTSKGGSSPKICTRCGRAPSHGRDHCPAQEATCHKCQKKGHFQSQCWTKGVCTMQVDDDIFIVAIHDDKHSGNNPWEATISINGLPVTFKIDTGADVSVASEATFHELQGVTLKPASKSLTGLSQQSLHVCGQFKGHCTYGA